MKRVKFLLAFVCLLAGSLTILAFSTGKQRSSSLGLECLRYIGPQAGNPDEFLYPYNWQPVAPAPEAYCTPGPLLCMICFDSFITTPAEAKQILWNYYMSRGTLPSHSVTIPGSGGKWVTVYRKI